MLSNQFSKKIVDQLYVNIPEFKKYAVESIDPEFIENGYFVFGRFGIFLTEQIMNDTSQQLVDRSFSYINYLCEKADKEITQMLTVTFFEILTDHKKVIETSKLKLKGKALMYFIDILNGPIFGGGKYAK